MEKQTSKGLWYCNSHHASFSGTEKNPFCSTIKRTGGWLKAPDLLTATTVDLLTSAVVISSPCNPRSTPLAAPHLQMWKAGFAWPAAWPACLPARSLAGLTLRLPDHAEQETLCEGPLLCVNPLFQHHSKSADAKQIFNAL